MNIKDYYLSFLCENEEDFFYLDDKSVDSIDNVNLSKEENYVKIDFHTTFGKKLSIVSNYDEFLNWYKKNKTQHNRPEELFKKYVKLFLKHSEESDHNVANMNEIIDDNGDIMPSTDLPSNATNSIVGDKLKWDLEKVYKTAVPRSLRYYSGNMGPGIVSW